MSLETHEPSVETHELREGTVINFASTQIGVEHVLYRVVKCLNNTQVLIQTLDHRRNHQLIIPRHNIFLPLTVDSPQRKTFDYRMLGVQHADQIGLTSFPVIADGNCCPTAAAFLLDEHRGHSEVRSQVVSYCRKNVNSVDVCLQPYLHPSVDPNHVSLANYFDYLERNFSWFDHAALAALAEAYARTVVVFEFNGKAHPPSFRIDVFPCMRTPEGQPLLFILCHASADGGHNGHFEPARLHPGIDLYSVFNRLEATNQFHLIRLPTTAASIAGTVVAAPTSPPVATAVIDVDAAAPTLPPSTDVDAAGALGIVGAVGAVFDTVSRGVSTRSRSSAKAAMASSSSSTYSTVVDKKRKLANVPLFPLPLQPPPVDKNQLQDLLDAFENWHAEVNFSQCAVVQEVAVALAGHCRKFEMDMNWASGLPPSWFAAGKKARTRK